MKRSPALLALAFLASSSGLAAATRPEDACQFLPAVIDVEASGTRYRTEVAFSNPNGQAQELSLRYTASLGSVEGAGEARFTVPAGGQLLARDGIDFLRQLGILIPPTTPQGGTILVCRTKPAAFPVAVTARVTSPVETPSGEGRAGVSFGAVPADEGFVGRAYVFGLRRNALDRSNVAIYNPGGEPVSVSLTVVSGSADGAWVVSAKETLPPYGWRQLSNPFGGAPGVEQGYVVIERTSAEGVFGAYGVVNDNDTNDGSFIGAVGESEPRTTWMVPVAVDSTAYRSELTLANSGDADATFSLRYLDSMVRTGVPRVATIDVAAHRQVILSDVFDLFRSGTPDGPVGTSAGTLLVRSVNGAIRGGFAGVRVLTRAERGRFGVFAPSFAPEAVDASQGFLWGLRADEITRSNVAILNASPVPGESVTLQLQAFDGATGLPAGVPLTVTLGSGEWAQPGGFFAASGAARGDVRIVRTGGTAPWSAYGVVNDGSAPGEGSGDGSFIPVVFLGAPEVLPPGPWGASGVKMSVDPGGIGIELDCAHGKAQGPIYVDPQGRFSAEGTWSSEGGPTPAGGFPVVKALFSGVVEKGQMTLTVRFPLLTPAQEVRVNALEGVVGDLRKCL